jgi:5-formyltetrahydrofolate cyclo-ligase
MFYVTHDAEVMTELMMEAALAAGKRVVVPVVAVASEWGLRACTVQDCVSDLSPGAFGIREPVNKEYVDAAEIDLVVVPGIVFDRYGHRLGYGRGYYDTWLKQFKKEKRVGLAFDIQLVEKLPVEANDLPVGVIVTETRTIAAKNPAIFESTREKVTPLYTGKE